MRTLVRVHRLQGEVAEFLTAPFHNIARMATDSGLGDDRCAFWKWAMAGGFCTVSCQHASIQLGEKRSKPVDRFEFVTVRLDIMSIADLSFRTDLGHWHGVPKREKCIESATRKAVPIRNPCEHLLLCSRVWVTIVKADNFPHSDFRPVWSGCGDDGVY
jgi:hypothetical protein